MQPDHSYVALFSEEIVVMSVRTQGTSLLSSDVDVALSAHSNAFVVACWVGPFIVTCYPFVNQIWIWMLLPIMV